MTVTSSAPAVLKDTTFSLRELDHRIAEHAFSIVLLMKILRAQKVTVVPAMDKLVKESRDGPFGPEVALGVSEQVSVGVGQYDDDGVRMLNSSYQMSRSVSMPRQRWRK